MARGRTRKRKARVYTKKQYSSGDGMLTTVWGPSLWHYLHTMSFNYPNQPTPENKKYFREFILNMEYVLPCKHCRQNLRKNFKVIPLRMEDMKNRESFSKYVYRLHELVNKMLGKKSNLSYCDVRERYEHFRARCTKDDIRKTKKRKKERGCTEPLYGKKAKCVIRIVPQETKCKTLQIDSQCVKKR